MWLIVGWSIAWVALATVVVFILKPIYFAQAELVLDTRVQHVSDFKSVMSGPLTTTDPSPIIRSETQLLKRDSLALRVIDTLKLDRLPEFKKQFSPMEWFAKTLVSWGSALLPKSAAVWLGHELDKPESSNGLRAALVQRYLQHLSVLNDGRSFTIEVGFRAYDPEIAAKVANTHVRLYLEEQRGLKLAAGQRALQWLRNELGRLGDELRLKERALQDFQENAGLVNAQGYTLTAQQAAQASSELSQARADLAQREARLAEVRASEARPEIQGMVLGSPVIQNLRHQEADMGRQLVVLQSRYEPSFPPVKQAQAQLTEIRSKIGEETGRIIANASTEVAVAKSRVNTLTASLGRLQDELLRQNRFDWQLKEMERDVEAQRSVYRDLLGREQQLAAQAGIEEADARLVSPALVPAVPYFPKKGLLIFFSLVLSAGSGIGLASWIGRPGSGIQRLEEVTELGHVRPFQSLPLVSPQSSRGRKLPDYLLEEPRSEFADAVRLLRGDVMLAKPPHDSQVLAITSAVPGEGKTTAAFALARSMAMAGLQVLLIDSDLRRPGVAKVAGIQQKEPGLIAVLGGISPLDTAVCKDPRSSLELLLPEQHVSAPPDLLWGPALKQLVDTARSSYDIAIIDTPPEGAVSDALLIAAYVDTTILLVKWNATPLSAVTRSIRAFEKRDLAVAGISLNAVDRSWLARRYNQERIYRSIRRYYVNS